jgi:hypothetical protein
MKFYNIVNVENLLARLYEDRSRPVVCDTMTELLLNSFLPQISNDDDMNEFAKVNPLDDSNSVKSMVQPSVNDLECIKRCIDFVRKAPEAAVAFYSYVPKHITIQKSVRLMILLVQTIGHSFDVSNPSNIVDELEQSAEIKKGGKRIRSKKSNDLECINNVSYIVNC